LTAVLVAVALEDVEAATFLAMMERTPEK